MNVNTLGNLQQNIVSTDLFNSNFLIERLEKWQDQCPEDAMGSEYFLLGETITALREQREECSRLCHEVAFEKRQAEQKQARIDELEERLRCWHEAIKDQGE